jgi:hypothetical protein
MAALPLCVPGPEDHALLVILHLAAADFEHPVGWIDLARHMGPGFDWDAFQERALDWRLRTPGVPGARDLGLLGLPGVPAHVVKALRPGRLRRHALRLAFRPGHLPLRARPRALGWPWVRSQTVLRDDSLRWTTGVLRYAGLRAVERVGRGRRG